MRKLLQQAVCGTALRYCLLVFNAAPSLQHGRAAKTNAQMQGIASPNACCATMCEQLQCHGSVAAGPSFNLKVWDSLSSRADGFWSAGRQ